MTPIEFEIKSKEIADKYPILFSEIGMWWGGEGWLDLIDKMSQELSQYGCRYLQLKEKFGWLRVHCMYSPTDSAVVNEIINRYESLSKTTCETCGAEGTIKPKGGWLKCSCERH